MSIGSLSENSQEAIDIVGKEVKESKRQGKIQPDLQLIWFWMSRQGLWKKPCDLITSVNSVKFTRCFKLDGILSKRQEKKRESDCLKVEIEKAC